MFVSTLTDGFKHKNECVSIVFCSERDDIFVPSTLQDLGHTVRKTRMLSEMRSILSE